MDAGALGTVTRFESRVERYSPQAVGNASGGGWLRDLGSHLVDQALQLFGPVDRVFAQLQFSPQHPALDHGFFVSLTHANGVISHLWGNALQNSQAPRFRVSGTLGCYTIEGLDGQEDALMAGKSPKTEGEHWGARSIVAGAGSNRGRSASACHRKRAAGRSSIASCNVPCRARGRCPWMRMTRWRPRGYWTPHA
jgi:predicted dehydrogenase